MQLVVVDGRIVDANEQTQPTNQKDHRSLAGYVGAAWDDDDAEGVEVLKAFCWTQRTVVLRQPIAG